LLNFSSLTDTQIGVVGNLCYDFLALQHTLFDFLLETAPSSSRLIILKLH